MRIVTGAARGARLETLDGEATRPTAERVKEALFSMIQFDIEGRRVLDLFAGSGQLGLEALSRGAARADFVDSSADAVAIIKRNAQKTRLFERCRVMNTDWETFLRGEKEPYHIVFLDPPYALGLIPRALARLRERRLLAPGALIVCESNSELPFTAEGCRLVRHNRYGIVYITLLTAEEENR